MQNPQFLLLFLGEGSVQACVWNGNRKCKHVNFHWGQRVFIRTSALVPGMLWCGCEKRAAQTNSNQTHWEIISTSLSTSWKFRRASHTSRRLIQAEWVNSSNVPSLPPPLARALCCGECASPRLERIWINPFWFFGGSCPPENHYSWFITKY